MAKKAFLNLQTVFKDRKLKIETKLRINQCYIMPVVGYASETRKLSADSVRRLNAFEMWILRRYGRFHG